MRPTLGERGGGGEEEEEEGEMLLVPCMRQYHRPSFGSASNLHHPRLVISILTLTKISRILEYII